MLVIFVMSAKNMNRIAVTRCYECLFQGGPMDGEIYLSIDPVSNDDYALVAKDEPAKTAYFKYREIKIYKHDEAGNE